MIRFEVACHAPPGRVVAVLGTGPLGGWSPHRCIELRAERPPLWTGRIHAASDDDLEFKYALVDPSRPGAVAWEADGPNRQARLKGKHADILILRGVFGDLSTNVEEVVQSCHLHVPGACEVSQPTTRAPSAAGSDSRTDSADVAEGAPQLDSSANLVSSCGEARGAEAAAEASERVLEAVRVCGSVRFGRFFHEAGAFASRYELQEGGVLGSGMSGEVCAAVSRATGDQCAVKTLATQGLDGEDRERVMAEVENQLRMDHPNICRLLEVFEEPGCLRLVMERMRGPDLFDHLLRRGRYTERDAAGCVRQITAAVAYCHRHGVCHRDLKLENFCLEDDSEDARVKLIDFGLSFVQDADVPMTCSCGTLYYVAPEVLRGSYDKKCDMWSIGVLAYILLDGGPPFNGRDDRATHRLIRQGVYHFDCVRWQRISRQAKDFVCSLLEVDVARRLDAEAALAHPWLAEAASGGADAEGPTTLDPAVLRSIRDFSKSNALKRAVLRAIAPAATAERVGAWVAQFEALDEDGDGKVAIQDLARRLVERGGLSASDAAELSAVLAESGEGGCLVSYSAFLAACMSAHTTLDGHQLQALFGRLDTNGSGTVSVDDVCAALGDVVDADDLRAEFAGRELSYHDFRWLMSSPCQGPSALELRQLLGAYKGIHGGYRRSARRAKTATCLAEVVEAARRKNVAWRVMFQKSQTGACTEDEEFEPTSPRKGAAARCLQSLLADTPRAVSGSPRARLSPAMEGASPFFPDALDNVPGSPTGRPAREYTAQVEDVEAARSKNLTWRQMHVQKSRAASSFGGV